MADKRRLQGDIDRTLKRVAEGRQSFQVRTAFLCFDVLYDTPNL